MVDELQKMKDCIVVIVDDGRSDIYNELFKNRNIHTTA